MKIKTVLAPLFVTTLALSLTGCLIMEDEGLVDDGVAQAALESTATSTDIDVEPLPACPDTEPLPGEPLPAGDADTEERTCASNGYCCNPNTGNVSKTTSAGCNGTWYANLAGCLTDPVCGSPSRNCYIN